MSDLSKVLGDLYGGEDDQPSVAPARNFRAEAPEWADDDRLDEAFADWTPGPSADAHRTEHEMSVVIDMPAVPAASLDDDLAASLNAALVDAGENDTEFPIAAAPSYSLPTMDEPVGDWMSPAPAPMAPIAEPTPLPVYEPIEAPVYEAPVPARPWSRGDDDILPGNAPKGAKAPKSPKAKSPKAAKEKLPKVPKVKAEKNEKGGDKEPVKVFGLQLRRK